MAENKKSFLLYCDLIHTVKQMPKEKAGELFMHILEYVNDLEPNTDDLIIQLTFEPIRQSLKRDLEKYERTRMKNKENAEKRWNKNNATVCDRIPPNAKNADSDNVSDNVNDNVINNNTINFDKLLLFLNSLTKRNFKIINEATKKKYLARLKEGYTNNDIANAMKNAVNSEYHKENNFTYLTPEFFSRAETLDKYSNTNNKTKEKNVNKSVIPKGVSFSGPQY